MPISILILLIVVSLVVGGLLIFSAYSQELCFAKRMLSVLLFIVGVVGLSWIIIGSNIDNYTYEEFIAQQSDDNTFQYIKLKDSTLLNVTMTLGKMVPLKSIIVGRKSTNSAGIYWDVVKVTYYIKGDEPR